MFSLQISYASTSEELSDKTKYDFLLRTVPSDKYQAKAMAAFIADKLKWKAVYGILEEGSYGENGMQKFKAAAKEKHICVVDTKVVTKTMQGSLNSRLNEILSEFYKEKKVPGIVLFCHQKIIDEILTVLGKNKHFREHFTWIGSDGWGLHTSARRMKINVTVFSLHAHSEKLGDFHRHYKSLRPGKNSQNPWFDRYWCWQCNKSAVNCPCNEKLNYVPPDEVEPTKKGEGKKGDEGKTEFPTTARPATNFKFCANDRECFRDDKVAYVIDAIYAVAHALKKLYQAKCPGSNKSDSKCLKNLKVDTTEFFNIYLKNVSFVGKTGRVSFANESLKGVYDISQLIGDTFKKVGTWNGLEKGSLNMTAAWKRGNAAAESQCGKNCSEGEVRKIRNGKECCWDCVACPKTEKVISLFNCKPCGNGYKQNGTFNGCEKIPEVHWDRGWLVAVSFLASVGCGLSFFVLAVFLRYRTTPVIMAASREISYALMFGIIMCYSLTFFMAAWPNAFTCGVIRFGTGFSICICYAALLVKTSRIARIFSGKPDPLFITPKWQLVLTGLLVLPQALIGVVGLLVNPPGVAKKFDSIEKTVVHCKSETNDLIVSISYNLLLILLCTVYAFRTRKVPENFNEARFIGFVMYTTCVIWLAFLPLFYGANWDYRGVALSLHLILNATTILFGLFGMKMYIVLLRPEKNIRANSKARSFSFPSDSNAHTVVNQDTVKGEMFYYFLVTTPDCRDWELWTRGAMFSPRVSKIFYVNLRLIIRDRNIALSKHLKDYSAPCAQSLCIDYSFPWPFYL